MAPITFYNPATKYKWFNVIWMAALLIFPVCLWMMPANFFDHTGFELCPSKLFFNIECFGCGMTRAVMHLHHLEWRDAIFYNYGIIAIYPILVIVWFTWLKKAWERQKGFGEQG